MEESMKLNSTGNATYLKFNLSLFFILTERNKQC